MSIAVHLAAALAFDKTCAQLAAGERLPEPTAESGQQGQGCSQGAALCNALGRREPYLQLGKAGACSPPTETYKQLPGESQPQPPRRRGDEPVLETSFPAPGPREVFLLSLASRSRGISKWVLRSLRANKVCPCALRTQPRVRSTFCHCSPSPSHLPQQPGDLDISRWKLLTGSAPVLSVLKCFSLH